MSRRPDDTDQLAALLRMLPTPEPPAQFAPATRRRYLEAIAARARREVLTGLVAALIGLAVFATFVLTVIEPAALVVWLAEAVADIARWTAGAAVVIALVPAVAWASVVLGSAAIVLSILLIARARPVSFAK